MSTSHRGEIYQVGRFQIPLEEELVLDFYLQRGGKFSPEAVKQNLPAIPEEILSECSGDTYCVIGGLGGRFEWSIIDKASKEVLHSGIHPGERLTHYLRLNMKSVHLPKGHYQFKISASIDPSPISPRTELNLELIAKK